MKLTFGEKVRNLREDFDLNQSQLAQKLGMTQRKISYIECGRNEPSIDDIRAICTFFNISSDYMLNLPHNLNFPKKDSANKTTCNKQNNNSFTKSSK